MELFRVQISTARIFRRMACSMQESACSMFSIYMTASGVVLMVTITR